MVFILPKFCPQLTVSGYSALHLAVELNEPAIIPFLLGLGLDPFLANADGLTPVALAAGIAEIELVFEPLTAEATDDLLAAAEAGSCDDVITAIEAGASVTAVDEVDTYNFLHILLVTNNDLECLEQVRGL